MPRIARIVAIGFPHHIVQRGNNKEKVFLDKNDYKTYLFLLEKYSVNKNVIVLAYCLMPNHVHLILKPGEEKTLFKTMQGVALCYTQYFNRKYNRTGRLWECRYHSTVIDEEKYLWAVCRYVEKNPVRAGIARSPKSYAYSSARAHILEESNTLLKEALFDEDELSNYKRFMSAREIKREVANIRKKTKLGQPLGDRKFVNILSEKLGRKLTFKPKGRPTRKAIL